MYMHVMPIYTKPIVVKIFIFIYCYFRVLFQLLKDCIWKPEVVILSRRFLNRFFPISYKLLLKYIISQGATLIWDYDDEIIETKEVSRKSFDYLSEKAYKIIVASPHNIEMIDEKYKHKAHLLPTTDGSMYFRLNDSIRKDRIELYKREFRIIWVGTSVSLNYVEKICSGIENAASRIQTPIILTVISNKPLEYSAKNFLLQNITWEREIAISEMLKSHIGIMPLENNQMTQGKGGFKLIQYLSVGLPVISSAVGINTLIVNSDVGFLCDNLDTYQWSDAIIKLADNSCKWENMSVNAYNLWLEKFSFNNNLRIWRSLIE